ncbi:MAG TPA: nuclear transport factor 2 family protein [Ktedonobacteraceae bacterium]|jgi:SnoaL-like protein|nr:nuclear transport factor 2 family protein [Ktedonobacteraceae bacterium]
MNAIDTVKTCITALQSGDIELAASILSDDFLLTGLTPNPLRKNALLALQGELLTAMPDFSYNLAGIHQEAREVIALIQITGTHTRDLALSVLGLPTIQATGIAITLPQVSTTFEVEEGKVLGMQSEVVPGGGIEGLLQQVGAELPLLPRLREISDNNLAGERTAYE